MDERFSLGLTYWPRRTGFGWWNAFDRGEVRENLAHIAALGCDTVRFCLRWEDFQPRAQRVNGAALRALEQALDAAYDADLRVVTVLFPVVIGGGLHLPEWTNRDDPFVELRRMVRFGPALVVQSASRTEVIYEGRYHTSHARDLFGDRAARSAQRYLIREVVGYFGAHPAIWAWQLGEGLERVSRPDSAEAIHEWLEATGEALWEQDGDALLLGVTSTRALTLRSGPRPEHLAAACDMIGIAADPPELIREDRPLHTAYVDYLYALTTALCGAPALVTSLGLPTAPAGRTGWIVDSVYGRPLHVYLADEEQQAEFIGAALELLLRAGARGVWLSAYADYPQDLWRMPPLDRVRRERTLGVVDAAGKEKPVAQTLRAFAAKRAEVEDAAPPIEVIGERYWREPKRSFEELWREFSTADY